MISQQFAHLSRHCIGKGMEFGEGDGHISSGTQVRTSRRRIHGVEMQVCNPSMTGASLASQDFLCCIHYLEHYTEQERILRHWWGLIKPDGIFVVALPEAGLYPKVGQPGCNPDHRVDFTSEGFLRDLASYGFKFEVVEKGYTSDSFYLVLRKSDAGSGAYVPEPVIAEPPPLPKYSVVIPFFNNATMTRKCLDTLLSVSQPDEVICVDDGSTDKTRFGYRAPGVRIVRLPRNSGFPYAVNKGVDEAKHEFVILLNNDVTMLEGGIEKLLSALRDPSVAMVGQDGGRLDNEFIFRGKAKEDPDYIEMFCCAFRKTVWGKVGPLDLDFGRGYSEDADWGMRAKKSGYRLATVDGCCHHVEAATFGRGPEILAQIERNRQYLIAKHHKGTCLWVMASLGCNGGSKVVYKLASAMQDDGWTVDVCSFRPWSEAGSDWHRFGMMTPDDVKHKYDVVVSTFHSTMPFAAEVRCQHRFALIQSDEGEWPEKPADKKWPKSNFMLPGFKHVIIADHMREFAKKYGMKIVGQIDNGVDSIVFHPTWTFDREWPHRLMLVRKSCPVWYAGAEYAEAAVRELAKKYRDLEVVVLGGERPKWPCKVEHVRTYDEREICGLYNKVSCVVVPSLIEGCSLVPLEAMSSGCPVVSTPVGMDYAVDGESYLQVPYKDSKAIVGAVSRVFDDEQLRWRLYKGGLRLAQQRTWEREQGQWLEIVYREIGK